MSATVIERVRAVGDGLGIEGELAYREDADGSRAALVLGPHPLLGGRIDQPLVRTIVEAIVARGVVAFTLAWRPEPEAEPGAALAALLRDGTVPADAHHFEEAAAARSWMRHGVGGAVVHVGYSLGATVGAAIARRCGEPAALVAPPLAHRPPEPGAAASAPLLAILPESDFAATPEDRERWIAALPPRARVIRCAGADHFLRGWEAEVGRLCAAFAVDPERADEEETA